MRSCLLVLVGLNALTFTTNTVAETPYADNAFFTVPHPGTPPGLPQNLTVAVGQTSATGYGNLEGNTAQVVKMIGEGAAQGARVVLFPEEGITGYYKTYIQNLTQQQLTAAEAQIAAACREHGVYAIVGIPHYSNSSHRHNTALVIDPRGEKIYRQVRYDNIVPRVVLVLVFVT